MYISTFPLNLLNNDDGGKTKVCFVCCMYQRIIRDINTYRFFEYIFQHFFSQKPQKPHVFFLQYAFEKWLRYSHKTGSRCHSIGSRRRNIGSRCHSSGSRCHNSGSRCHNSGSRCHNIGIKSRSSLLLLKASFLTAKFAVS